MTGRPEGSRLLTELRTVPNLLSLSRIVLVYISAGVLLWGWPLAALGIGLLAGVSDYLDGWLARRLGQVTELGAILDRLCDLVFESTWIAVAVWYGHFPQVALWAYLFREFVVLSARLWCSAHGVSVGSTLAGKLKSNFLGYTAGVLFLSHVDAVAPVRGPLVILASFGMAGGLLLSYWSAGGYLRVFARAYDEQRGR